MGRYGDRWKQRESRVPSCFGRQSQHNSESGECLDCEYADQCSDEIENQRPMRSSIGRSIGSSLGSPLGIPVKESRYVEPVGETPTGVIREGESAFERFCKDSLTGACRGMAYEMYRFFCRFRF